MKIIPGKIQSLPILSMEGREVELGTEENHISLFKGERPSDAQVGDPIEVFVYFNEDRQLEATRKLPEIELGGVGSFRVKNTGDFGAFIDIGTRRDILLPVREQKTPVEEGRMILITLQCDMENRRLFASTRLTQFFKNNLYDYQRGQEVDMIIADRLEMGYRVIINGKHIGALFRQELMRNVHEGEKVKGYIRKIEGKEITVSMQKEGEELIQDAVDRLLEFLKHHNGYIRLTDDSDPEEIKLRLRMSKKTFKKAVGQLYKDRRVTLTKFGLKLILTEEEKNPPTPAPIRRKKPSADE